MLFSRRWFSLAVSLAAASGLSACGGAAPAGSSLLPNVPRAAHAIHQSALPSQLIFVPDSLGAVYIFSLKSPAQGPVGLISNLPGFQVQSTVDGKGNFYIGSQGTGFFNPDEYYVAKFAPPYNGKPVYMQTVWNKLYFAAIGVTADSKGNIYVSACGEYCNLDPNLQGILVYPPGSIKPKRFIPVKRYGTLGALTTDGKDNLYGLTWDTRLQTADVFKIAAGSNKPKFLRLAGFNAGGDTAGGVAVDAAGDVYVGNTGPASSYILEYRPHTHEPFRQIDEGVWITMAAYPMFFGFGPDGNLYVPMGCGAGTQATHTCPQVYGFKPKVAHSFESFGSQLGATTTMSVSFYPNPLLGGARR
jgi:hypothetical protein